MSEISLRAAKTLWLTMFIISLTILFWELIKTSWLKAGVEQHRPPSTHQFLGGNFENCNDFKALFRCGFSSTNLGGWLCETNPFHVFYIFQNEVHTYCIIHPKNIKRYQKTIEHISLLGISRMFTVCDNPLDQALGCQSHSGPWEGLDLCHRCSSPMHRIVV